MAWDQHYRPLSEGEIICEGDEVLTDHHGWRKAICVGEPAPYPYYTAHRMYRRLQTTPTPIEPAPVVGEVEAVALRAEVERLGKIEAAADSTYTHWRARALAAESQVQSLTLELAERDKALEQANEIGSLATKFRISDDVCVESRGAGVWAVVDGGMVLNTDGIWEYEPQPSSRSDEFIARTRYAFADAFGAARALQSQGSEHA